jgi:CheY-like chemotaxis protein
MARRFEGLTILVVEDEPVIGLDVQAILEAEGARVIVEATHQGAQARIAFPLAIDAAVLDFVLADSTGGELAEQFLKAGTPFVFLTASAADLPERHAAIPRIEKPFAPRTLIDALQVLLTR